MTQARNKMVFTTNDLYSQHKAQAFSSLTKKKRLKNFSKLQTSIDFQKNLEAIQVTKLAIKS